MDRVFRTDAYADILLHEAYQKRSLTPADRALATELTYGTLRWLGRLDWILERTYRGKLNRMPGLVRRVIEIGLYQILFLTRIPSYAAVDEAVRAAKESGGESWGRVANAVLRAAIRDPERTALLPPETDPVLRIAIQESHPLWLVRKWIEQYGEEKTRSLCVANNALPAFGVRVNPLKADKAAVRASLDAAGCRPSDSKWHDDFFVLERMGDALTSRAFRDGWFTVQDESAGFAVRLLDPRPGEVILDMAAAPGGKATGLAERSGDRQPVVAVDRYVHRARQIVQNTVRLGIRSVFPVVADGRTVNTKPVDKVLLDVPCSGFGIVRRHPEIKWRRTADDVVRLAPLQGEMLAAAAQSLKTGGVLVYSTCTPLVEENTGIVFDFLRRQPDFAVEPADRFLSPAVVTGGGWIETWPDLHGMDASFAIRLRKRG